MVRKTRQAPAFRPGLALAAVCVAGGVLPASLSGASVALPTIGTDLAAQLVPLQWVVNAYNLTFASFMLATGGMADRLGRRRMFLAGGLLFTACSVLSALAGNVILLDVARGLAGVGAAAVLTAGSAALAATFDGAARARAFGILGSSFGAGLALGPSLAGFLVSAFGWRSVFLAHAVVVAGALVAARGALGESRNPAAVGVDWWGTGTFTGGLFLFALAVLEGPQRGWRDGPVLVLFAGAAALLVAFVVAERYGRAPMFDLGLLRQPRFVAVCLMPVVLAFGFVCPLVLLPSYFSSAGGLSPERAGILMMALTVPVLVLPVLAGLAVRRVPARVLLGGSLVLMAAGTAWLTVPGGHASWLAIAGPLAVIGSGMGIAAGLLDGAAVSTVPAERAGMAAGMFNTARLAGETVAIVLVSAVLVSLVQRRIAAGAGRYLPLDGHGVAAAGNRTVAGDLAGAARSAPAGARSGYADLLAGAFTGALHEVLWVLCGVCLLGAVVMVLLLGERRAAPVPAGGEVPAREPLAAAAGQS